MRGPTVIAIAFGVVAAPLAPRWAAAEEARLIYVRPPGVESCPDVGEVRDAVVARLGYDPFRDAASRTVEATIARRGRALDGTIRLLDADGRVQGERRLSSENGDCAELASAVELAISLALDPVRVAAPSGPARPLRDLSAAVDMEIDVASDRPSSTTTGFAASRSPPVRRGVTARPAARGYVAIGPVVATDLGAATPGLAVEGGVAWSGASVGLEARVAGVDTLAMTGGGEAELSAGSVAATACGRGRVFSWCALGGVAVVRARGAGYPGAREATAHPAQVGVRLAAELALVGDLAARAFLGGRVLLDDVSVQSRGEVVWEAPRVGLDVGAALTLRIW